MYTWTLLQYVKKNKSRGSQSLSHDALGHHITFRGTHWMLPVAPTTGSHRCRHLGPNEIWLLLFWIMLIFAPPKMAAPGCVGKKKLQRHHDASEFGNH